VEAVKEGVMDSIPVEQVESYNVSTVTAYLEKVREAAQSRIPLGVVSRDPASGLPTDLVAFPPVRVIVDMWKIVRSPAARPATMREAFGR
jgi:hypothetical protein